MVSLSYGQLRDSFNEMRIINKHQEKRVRYREQKAIHLAVAYFIIQALIFLPLTQSSSAITCRTRWIPFSLAATVAAVFALVFTSAISSWARTHYHYDVNLAEQNMIYREMVAAKNGGAADVKESDVDRRIPQPDMLRVYQRQAVVYLTGIALFVYTAVILKACRSLPCNA